ncbi:hypothetical protein G7046_g8606 [Stylonectria norvegica]|nr:hypothetical protein G7046_g8606 [Stylonectria norvegica]
MRWRRVSNATAEAVAESGPVADHGAQADGGRQVPPACSLYRSLLLCMCLRVCALPPVKLNSQTCLLQLATGTGRDMVASRLPMAPLARTTYGVRRGETAGANGLGSGLVAARPGAYPATRVPTTSGTEPRVSVVSVANFDIKSFPRSICDEVLAGQYGCEPCGRRRKGAPGALARSREGAHSSRLTPAHRDALGQDFEAET